MDTEIPIFMTPMKANSSVAPIRIPACRSPKTKPTSGPRTIGLVSIM